MEGIANPFSDWEWSSLLACQLLVTAVQGVVSEDEPDVVPNVKVYSVVVSICLSLLLFLGEGDVALDEFQNFLHALGVFKGGLVVDVFGLGALRSGVLPVEGHLGLVLKAGEEG